jgi:hypothetical protein
MAQATVLQEAYELRPKSETWRAGSKPNKYRHFLLINSHRSVYMEIELSQYNGY